MRIGKDCDPLGNPALSHPWDIGEIYTFDISVRSGSGRAGHSIRNIVVNQVYFSTENNGRSAQVFGHPLQI